MTKRVTAWDKPTLSRPDGATPKQPVEFKPLNTDRYLRTANRKAAVEDAPSKIGGKLHPAPGNPPIPDSRFLCGND